MQSIQSLKEQFGISAENKPAECTECASLDQIRKQLSYEPGSGRITDSAEIKNIMDHILWRRAADCPYDSSFPLENNYHVVFNFRALNVNPEVYQILPDAEDTTVADLLVLADWFSANFKGEYKTPGYSYGIIKHQEYTFAKTLWSLFYNMAHKDPYFKKLRSVEVKAFVEFLHYKDGFCRKDIPDIYWGNDKNDNIPDYYKKPVYELYPGITFGYMLDHIENYFKAWDPGEEGIEKYEEHVYYGCRTMQSIVHAICTAYFDVDARIAFLKECASDWDKRREILTKERQCREETQRTRFII